MSDSMSEQSSFASDGSRDLSTSENEEYSPSPPKPTRLRPSRQRTLPAKLKDSQLDVRFEEITLDMTRSAVVKCSQTGKLHQVKIKDLSREDCEPLTKEDLVKGSELMLEIKGKIYPVQFHHMKDKASTTNNSNNKKARCDENVSETPSRAKAARKEKSNSRKRPAGSDEGLRDKTNVTEILAKAKDKPSSKKQKCDDDDQDNETLITASSGLDDVDKDLLVNLAGRIEKMMVKMMEILKNGPAGVAGAAGVKKEDEECIVNGVNVMRIPSRDAYSFGLQLLNILFTKEELAVSLLFKSKKSEKPGLEQGRVEKMLRLIEKRFGNDWDLRTLSQKVNQKCRDSSKDMHAPMQA